MISAQQALNDIERAILGVRRDEDRLVAMLADTKAEGDRLRAGQADAFRALARLRLDAIARDEVVGELDSVERRARAALDKRRDRLAELKSSREGASQKLDELEGKREAAVKLRDAAIAAVEAKTDAVEARLATEGEWQALSAAVATAEATAAAAEEKRRQAEEDRAVKGKPYEDDRLFMYLWQRGYGTSAYRAGPLTRYFDGKVAKLAGYDAARVNYFMLTEIPLRLAEHAERLKADVATAVAARQAYERAALEADGIGPLEAAVAEADRALAKVETDIARVRSDVDSIDKETAAALDDNGDPAVRGVIDDLAGTLSRSDMVELVRRAEATPTPEDDRIVKQLRQIERDLVRVDAQAEELRRTSIDMASKRQELEHSRDTFRRNGYDRPNGSFSNGETIGNLIGGIISGAITAAVLEGAFRDGYRRGESRRRDDFGGGPWGGGGSWGGGGRSGGGGFGTGGGSGGGGFKTGGGF
ncbi:conserved hypothetical protein [uncultured Pleomorphomonas sp.]|uniref:Uncharacterized protein n=1 Tax=uncultured Pleomorphomonas sp. TaxID=442121 RepID=A0A212L7R7_9HYPH|nr:hypothetical protein [uncultured Pleomorphomonas sp.]SCM73623.1 conserved hypothetical protein [uncultured Pleomorphomonas sp.]